MSAFEACFAGQQGFKGVPQPRFRTAALRLTGVVYQAPRILEILSQASRKNLSATSRDMRKLVHSLVTVITVQHEEDIACLLRGNWSQLGMIILPDRGICYYRSSVSMRPGFELLGRIDLSCSIGHVDVAFLLKSSQHLTNTAYASNQLAVKPLERLLQEDWSALTQLKISYLKSSAMAAPVIAMLSKGSWPLLTSIDLTGSILDVKSICHLIKGKWTALKHLDLTSTQLDTETVRQLVEGQWPALQRLRLSLNPLMDAVTISQLAKADCPLLDDLSLEYMPLGAAAARELVKLQLPCLRFLGLGSAKMDIAAMSELSKADWPVLWYLNLSCNNLCVGAVVNLVQAHLPGLASLFLRDAGLDSAAMECMIQGNWPQLQQLHLSDNRLDVKALKRLVKGNWKKLYMLSMQHNMLGKQAIKELIKGKWPLLQCLSIDYSVFNKRNAVMLSIHPDQLENFDHVKKSSNSFMVPLVRDREVAPTRACRELWPSLKQVSVW